MDQTIATLEHEIRSLQLQAQDAERLAAIGTDPPDGDDNEYLALSLRVSVACLQTVLDRIRGTNSPL
jgi:hypothetical protein